MKNLFDLSGKLILITGGAGILGRQHAEAVTSHGAVAIVADINYIEAQKLSKYLNEKYSKTVAIPEYMDVLDKSSIIQICEKYDKIDILINNAAKDTKVEKKGDLNTNIRFETMSYDHWKNDMEVGLGGCFLCSQVVANKMITTGGGNIINIASDLATIAPDQRIYRKDNIKEDEQHVKPVTYSVSKWALLGLTKYMSTYFADKNIRVNSLSPAGIYNPALPDDFVDKLTSLIPMGRMADTGEYAGAIVFLCSEASSYMTGANMIIDGGRTVW
jgi:NAD(P)-dependent dehydrogenase (short-subunit alcohol dehydrogenase family)